MNDSGQPELRQIVFGHQQTVRGYVREFGCWVQAIERFSVGSRGSRRLEPTHGCSWARHAVGCWRRSRTKFQRNDKETTRPNRLNRLLAAQVGAGAKNPIFHWIFCRLFEFFKAPITRPSHGKCDLLWDALRCPEPLSTRRLRKVLRTLV